MTAGLARLSTMVGSTANLKQAAASRREGKFWRWRPTRIQREMLSCPARYRLLRGPSQVGKTEAMCADAVDLLLGVGRWQPDRARKHPPPVQCWIVCSSWKQSLTIQRKLWSMLPHDQLARSTKYTEKRGFTGQSLELKNKSLCTIVTIKQDVGELASATLDGVFVDEVPTEDAWGELVARVRAKDGFIATYFTPVNRPTLWFKKRVDSKEIVEHHTALTLEAVTPEGALRPFQSQEQIDQFIAVLPPWRKAQQAFGEWEGATEGRWVPAYDPTRHDRAEDPQGVGWRLCVACDYGLRPGKMSSHLIAVKGGHTTTPEVCFWDEAAATEKEAWSMADLTSHVLRMLARNGVEYDDVDVWVGDRSAIGKGGKVSNRELRAHLAAALGRTQSQVKAVLTPRKGAGSVEYGCGLINAVFARNAAWVHPNCTGLRQFLAHFDGDPHDPLKDQGDSARYGFITLVDASAWYKV